MSEPITFKRNGAIMRDCVRIGWVQRREDGIGKPYWAVVFTPASGRPGLIPNRFSLRRDAKMAALMVLSTPHPSDPATARALGRSNGPDDTHQRAEGDGAVAASDALLAPNRARGLPETSREGGE